MNEADVGAWIVLVAGVVAVAGMAWWCRPARVLRRQHQLEMLEMTLQAERREYAELLKSSTKTD